MSSNVYSVGLRNVGSYQVSGAPFVSGGISSAVATGVRIAFPYVTSWVKVYNQAAQGAGVNVGFSQRQVEEEGAAGESNYFFLDGALDTGVLDLKLSEIWISGSSTSITVLAGLTNIPTRQIDNTAVSPSGSQSAANIVYGASNRNWSGSVGVG